MSEITVTIHHDAGLHARPLAQFVKAVKSHDAEVQVYNVTSGKGPANGASPVKLMLLSVTSGQSIRIIADGPQADEVLQALNTLIESNFGEE
jgi:phosphotransferase system HPr (HPr) family protein